MRCRALAPVAALLLALATAGSAPAREVRVGDTLPAVEVQAWNGGPVSLNDLRGRVIVLDFWASWCATCRTALPALDAIARRHPNGIAFAAVNIDKTQVNADRFLAEHLAQTVMTLLRDPDGTAMAHFGAAGMPALYIVDRDGVVRFVEAGYAPEKLSAAEQAIEDILRVSPKE